MKKMEDMSKERGRRESTRMNLVLGRLGEECGGGHQ